MNTCWQLVCDARREAIWCGQDDYMYYEDVELMKDLSAFLYACRGHSIRVVCDWDSDCSEDYTEVGSLPDGWEVYAIDYNGESIVKKSLGVYGGSRRQALAAAAAKHFPDERYFENTNVLTGPWHLEAE